MPVFLQFSLFCPFSARPFQHCSNQNYCLKTRKNAQQIYFTKWTILAFDILVDGQVARRGQRWNAFPAPVNCYYNFLIMIKIIPLLSSLTYSQTFGTLLDTIFIVIGSFSV